MHWIMTCEGLYPPTTLSEMPDFSTGPWFTGQPVSNAIAGPLRYVIDPEYEGQVMPLYECAYPLFRDDLLAVLVKSGVDNLQLFDAIVEDPQRGLVYTHFKAVNIIGCVAMADLARSTTHGTRPVRLIATDFASLTLDHAAAPEILLCRLAEAVSAVVVHDRVRQAIEDAPIDGITFLSDGEWSTL
jgi:hypothetical protein